MLGMLREVGFAKISKDIAHRYAWYLESVGRMLGCDVQDKFHNVGQKNSHQEKSNCRGWETYEF